MQPVVTKHTDCSDSLSGTMKATRYKLIQNSRDVRYSTMT